MKRRGYIQPTPATASLWAELKVAKAARNIERIGALSAQIRTETVRNAEQHRDSVNRGSNHAGGDSGDGE